MDAGTHDTNPSPNAKVTEEAEDAWVRPRLVVGIPSFSRPDILLETVRAISRQTRLPDLVLLSVVNPEHTGGLETESFPFPVQILMSGPGLSRQRNRILNSVRPGDILLFLDDDFLMAPDYLDELERIFRDHPDIVQVTGTVVADGILGAGFDHEQGEALLKKALNTAAEDRLDPVHTGYGCNTAMRMSTVQKTEVFFDERLPLYSWLEDADFSSRLKPHGRVVRATALRGVHLGTKTGRTPGIKLGYSQIANPVYLLRKGTISWRRARGLMLRNFGSNIVGTIRPRPWADYRGRLFGNLVALFDICLGRSDPRRILELRGVRTFQRGRWRRSTTP